MILLRPSASHIWTACEAMPRLSADIPEPPPSDPAREGTAAAWVAEQVLKGAAGSTNELIGTTHENGWLIDADMAELVQGYVDHLLARGGEVHAERTVVLNPMIKGTPDSFAVLTVIEGVWRLYVDDLKFGYDIVEPFRNTQVSIYAGALLRMLWASGKQIDQVVIGIYQPRAHHHLGIYRTWKVWPDELMKFVEWIEARGNACQDVRSRATPGFHCEYCPAAGVCSAVVNTTYKGFRILTDENAIRMTGAGLAHELDFLDLMDKLLKARRTAVRAEAEARMKRGEYVPNYGFEEGHGNRRFTLEPEQIRALTGLDPYDKPKACTPAELIRRGKAKGIEGIEETVGRMSIRPRIPPKLTRYDSDRFQRLFDKSGPK